MLNYIANIFLYIGTICACFTAMLPNFPRSGKVFFIACISPIIAFILLIIAFANSDFSVLNVYLNSSTIKPLIYKIAGTWSSHEGSMLLWVGLIALLSLVNYCYVNQLPKNLQLKTNILRISSLILLFFLVYINMLSNPFIKVPKPTLEGLGLNPLLQDVGLAIHPPLLYLGYSALVPIFINLTSMNFSTNGYQETISITRKWSILTWTSLTLAVSLGSWWAYRELGWGGYWFFDPVENASLLIWLLSTAFHHCFTLHSKNKPGYYLFYMLGLSLFLVTILNSFLIRSGALVSVHNFAFEAGRGTYLLIFFLTMLIISIYKILNLSSEEKSSTFSFYEIKMISGIGLLLVCFIAVFTGTFYPVISEYIQGYKVTIGEQFFINSFLPYMISAIIFSGFFTGKQKLHFKIFIFISATIALALTIAHYGNNNSLLSIFGLFAGYLITFSSAYNLIRIRDIAKSIKKISTNTAHLGLGVLTLGITISSCWTLEKTFEGKIGHNIEIQDKKITLTKTGYGIGKNYLMQKAHFTLEDKNGNELATLEPENRFYPLEKVYLPEIDIKSKLQYDVYAVITNISGDIISANFMIRPMLWLIWLGSFIMVLGGSLSFILLRHNKISTN